MIQWPSNSKIKCFDMDGALIAESKRSRLDLADSLMLTRYVDTFTCQIEVSTEAASWVSWNSVNVKRIEDHIEYDLTLTDTL